jgi:hypothetical protein
MSAELQTIMNINWGQNIAPKGTGVSTVPRGPYIGIVKVCGVGGSRKQGSTAVGIRATIAVTAPEQVGDVKTVGTELDVWMSLPEGNDFSQDTPAGRGNRARVAEIKSFLVAATNQPEWVMQRNNLEQFDLNTVVNLPVRFFFEPAPPPTITEKVLPDGNKRSDTEFHYADFTWLSIESYEKVVAGTLKIQPRPVKQTAAAPQGPGPVGMGGVGGAPTGAPMGAPLTTQPPLATPPTASFIPQPTGSGGVAGAPGPNGATGPAVSAASAAAKLVGIPGLG